MLANYHMHTNFSNDSDFKMEDVVKTAINRGLDEICITDHLDCTEGFEQNFDYKAYEREFLRCKSEYGDKINLKLGMEFGMSPSKIKYFNDFFNGGNFDFVIMSTHAIGSMWLCRRSFDDEKIRDNYVQEYYEQLYTLVDNHENYSVLGHLDVYRRYDLNGEYPFEKIKDRVEEILKKVIEKGKGIELNTSSFRYNLGDLTPSREILKLYKKMGGEIITLGSDSHREIHVVQNLKDGIEELIKLGFKSYCTFDKMKPIFHDLEL